MKITKTMWVIIIIALLLFMNSYKKEDVSCSETMTRSGPLVVEPNEQFQITYTAIGTSGSWGASIMDSVSGGCKFPSGNPDYQTVMLSEDGTTKTITMAAAPTDGPCVFSGDYKYGTCNVVNLNSYTVSVETCQPVCTRPTNLCVEGVDVSDGCGGNCAGHWTVVQLTDADANCDYSINRTELGVAIQMWISATLSRTDLGLCIMDWAGG